MKLAFLALIFFSTEAFSECKVNITSITPANGEFQNQALAGNTLKGSYNGQEFEVNDDDGLLLLMSVSRKIYGSNKDSSGSLKETMNLTPSDVDQLKSAMRAAETYEKDTLAYYEGEFKKTTYNPEQKASLSQSISKSKATLEQLKSISTYVSSFGSERSAKKGEFLQKVGSYIDSRILAGSSSYTNLKYTPDPNAPTCAPPPKDAPPKELKPSLCWDRMRCGVDRRPEFLNYDVLCTQFNRTSNSYSAPGEGLVSACDFNMLGVGTSRGASGNSGTTVQGE